MRFIESRLLGIKIDESGREVILSFVDTHGAKFDLQLHGVERLLVNEMRQQNVVEKMIHWKQGRPVDGLGDAAFALMADSTEEDCAPQLMPVAREVINKVMRGELEMLEISAIFGAQVLVSFVSMSAPIN